MSYLAGVASMKETPQDQAIPGSAQVQNSAGGFSFAVDEMKRVERFLVLGSEGGSYYASERKLSEANAAAVIAAIKKNGLAVVEMIVSISQAGRAPKNDPALFALALAASYGDPQTRNWALDALPRVARTGTHLLHFVDFVNSTRRWSRMLRNGLAKWYEREDVAYQVAKYQSRDGWSHRDVLRLCHAKAPETHERARVFRWIAKGGDCDVQPIAAMQQAHADKDPKVTARLIREFGLTREMVPTEHLADIRVWEALFEKMPMEAMVRNLAKMTEIGLLTELGDHANTVAGRLRDVEQIRKARLHPVQLLMALRTYGSGRGVKGNLQWKPIQQIVGALEDSFYLAFQAVEPTNKRFCLGLDVSGSMEGGRVAGTPLTPREASAVMSMVTARTEERHIIRAFSDTLAEVTIGPKASLEKVIACLRSIPMGGTDCSLPIIDAERHKIPVDVFVVYTDSETWAGHIHPPQALRRYRDVMGIPAKLIVVGMVSNGFTIADPNDAGMLDVVGFDTAAPALIADFAKS